MSQRIVSVAPGSLAARSGMKEGETLEFGGLFGSGPVMSINKFSPAKFISRGGHIPAPLQSLKN